MLKRKLIYFVLFSYILCFGSSLTAFDIFRSSTQMQYSPLFGVSYYLYFLVASVFIILIVAILFKSNISHVQYPSLAFLLGAMIYNFSEFVVFKRIIDYLPGMFGTKSNAADYVITISLILVILKIFRSNKLFSNFIN